MRFSKPNIKLKTKISGLLAVIGTAFVAASILWQLFSDNNANQILNKEALEKSSSINRWLDSDSLSLGSFANMVRRWNSKKDELLKGDPKWLAENLASPIVHFSGDAVAVFEESAIPIYQYKLPTVQKKELFKFGPADFDAMFLRDDYRHFFHRDEGGLIEYWASKFKSDKTGKKGILIVSKYWDQKTLANYERLTATEMAVYAGSSKMASKYVVNGSQSYTVYRVMNDEYGNPSAVVSFQGSNPIILLLQRQMMMNTLVLIAFSMLVVLISYRFLTKWVTKPLELASLALQTGSSDHLKPVLRDRSELGELSKMIRLYFMQQGRLKNIKHELEELVEDRTKELADSHDAVILGWSRAMDIRDQETEGHTQRVAVMALHLADQLGLDEKQKKDLYRGALLHDIGKIGVPDSILLKPGKLTPEEFEVMKGHAELAYQMLQPLKFLRDSLDVPRFHHERWDGKGYPMGLRGDSIPYLARIFAVADVWDALRSDRPYRDGWPEEKVREYLAAEAGSHFDPQVVEAFLKMDSIAHPKDEQFKKAA